MTAIIARCLAWASGERNTLTGAVKAGMLFLPPVSPARNEAAEPSVPALAGTRSDAQSMPLIAIPIPLGIPARRSAEARCVAKDDAETTIPPPFRASVQTTRPAYDVRIRILSMLAVSITRKTVAPTPPVLRKMTCSLSKCPGTCHVFSLHSEVTPPPRELA